MGNLYSFFLDPVVATGNKIAFVVAVWKKLALASQFVCTVLYCYTQWLYGRLENKYNRDPILLTSIEFLLCFLPMCLFHSLFCSHKSQILDTQQQWLLSLSCLSLSLSPPLSIIIHPKPRADLKHPKSTIHDTRQT